MSPREAAAPGLGRLDSPNSYIGRSVPRPNARRLLEGQARYVDDVHPLASVISTTYGKKMRLGYALG